MRRRLPDRADGRYRHPVAKRIAVLLGMVLLLALLALGVLVVL